MNIRKAHCFFEQSGTFKGEFIKLGIPAEDYDIQDNFGQTDHVTDLFTEIEKAWDGKDSLFDTIMGGQDGDLVMAFFPCVYFCQNSTMLFNLSHPNYRKLTMREKVEKILEREINRSALYRLLIKLYAVCLIRGIRLIKENPYSPTHYLQNQNFLAPQTMVDKDRSARGDWFKKPTAYWFVNCEPLKGHFTEQRDKEVKAVYDCAKGEEAGICSEERSMISPDYARNFICDFLLGREQPEIDRTLFNFA